MTDEGSKYRWLEGPHVPDPEDYYYYEPNTREIVYAIMMAHEERNEDYVSNTRNCVPDYWKYL